MIGTSVLVWVALILNIKVHYPLLTLLTSVIITTSLMSGRWADLLITKTGKV